MAGYDPKKAETYNKLRRQGLSDEAAFRQSGISDAEADNYVVNDVPGDPGRGSIGPFIAGTGTITQTPSAAAQRESAQFYQGLERSNFERVDYPVKANSNPSARTTTNYVNTSTEQVSGGGSTTITSGLPKANAQSDSLQAQADIKTAEIARYNESNPVTRDSTPAQIAQRRAVLGPLIAERNQLANQAEAAKTPTEPTTTTVPNTTTNTSTTTYSQESTNTPVQSIAGDDPVVNQQQEQRAGFNANQVSSLAPAPVNTEETFSPGESTITTVTAPEPLPDPREAGIAAANEQTGLFITPAPGTVETFRPEQSTITAVTKEPGPDTYQAGGGGGNQGTITRVTYQPADVSPTEDPAAGEAAANDQQSTITGARGGNVQENEQLAAANQAAIEERARQQQAIRDQFQSPANGDWRVKLKLGPDATYLYKDSNQNSILAPLAASDGVIFPYMPDIQTSYNANYDTTDLTHSNYRGYFYKNSYVGDINITGVFTAQNTAEANYLLAVIHFFRTATKMFYGQNDSFRGAPPPLVYLFGLGQYQFNAHPCVIRSFTYNLPNDVDYIRTKPNNYNVNFNNTLPKTESGGNPISAVFNRLRNALLPKGAIPNVPQELLTVSQSVSGIDNSTYVPTKITVQISLLPIQTRSQQSQQFNVKGFANGDLLKGGFW